MGKHACFLGSWMRLVAMNSISEHVLSCSGACYLLLAYSKILYIAKVVTPPSSLVVSMMHTSRPLHLQCSPRTKFKAWQIGIIWAEPVATTKACGLSIFPHQREFCTEGLSLLGRYALGMLARESTDSSFISEHVWSCSGAWCSLAILYKIISAVSSNSPSPIPTHPIPSKCMLL